MNIYNLPDDLRHKHVQDDDELAIYNYEVPNSAMKNKIILNRHVISFLVEGQKDVRFADKFVSIDTTQALLISKGNFLMTEHIGSKCFKCLLFFFSQKKVSEFLLKHHNRDMDKAQGEPASSGFYFQIEKDLFINQFVNSLNQSFALKEPLHQNILNLKLEEILLYLVEKYGQLFVAYLKSLLEDEQILSFRLIVEENVGSNLSIEEIAFLCSMSLSTFKRKFFDVYQVPPGKWFQKRRLQMARELIVNRKLKASQIYMDFGYNNLSGFSIAFKNEFGFSPKEAY